MIAVVGVAAYVAAAASAGDLGFPLDDSWIHQVYGRSLALTGQWAFVPGVPSAASTSPLYTVLLAIGYALRVPFYLWTYALGALALAAAGLLAARLARALAAAVSPDLRYAGLAAGLVTVTAWHFVWAAAAGMETVVFVALSLALMVWSAARLPIDSEGRAGSRMPIRYGVGLGVLGALLTLARPEGVGLFALSLGAALAAVVAEGSGTRVSRLRPAILVLVGAGIAWVLCMTPYAALNLGLNGTLLPNTSAAKQAENAPLLAAPILNRVAYMIYPLIAGGQLILLPGLVRALVALVAATHRPARRARIVWFAPAVWPFALIGLYAWRLPAPYQHGRYVIPALAPYLVLASVGLLMLLGDARRLRTGRTGQAVVRALIRSLAVTAALGFAVFWWNGAGIFAKEVGLINGEMVDAAHWIADHVPPAELLAVHDIGAVGYFAPRPILDLAGLVSPEVIPVITDPQAVIRLMEARGVRWLMVSPYQLPMQPDDPRLCRAYETAGADSPVHMSVYRIAWDSQCAGVP